MIDLYKKLDRPHHQALAVFGGALLLMLAGWVLERCGHHGRRPAFRLVNRRGLYVVLRPSQQFDEP
jgi:hypothetical protein